MIVGDEQGVTGRKRSELSLPYGRILAFPSETKGTMDPDSGIVLHVQERPAPVALQFRENAATQAVQRRVARRVRA